MSIIDACRNCGETLISGFVRGFCNISCEGAFYGRRAENLDYGKTRCEKCGNEFNKKSTNQKYCSATCRHKGYYKTSKYIIKCSYCNKEFEGHKNARYCSGECSKIKHLKECRRCGKKYTNDHSRSIYCSETCVFLRKECEGCEKEYRTRDQNKKYCSTKCMNSSRKKTHEEYMEQFFSIHKGNIVPLELYKGSDHSLKVMCLHCSNEMNGIARMYIGSHKSGCKHCNNKSHGENEISEWLEYNNIEYVRQYSFDDLKYKSKLYYDFAIMNEGVIITLIEYDGEQHYKSIEHFGGDDKLSETQERDQIKTNHANKISIPLLRISYKQRKNITEILNKEILIPPVI